MAAMLALALAAPAPAETPQAGPAAPPPRPQARPEAVAVAPVLRPQPRPPRADAAASAEVERTGPVAPVRRPRARALPPALPVSGPALPSSPRPRLRPPEFLRLPVVVQVAARPSALPRLAAIAPPERPENLQRLSQAVAMRPQAYPDPVGAKGSVCGVEAIRGTPIPAIPAKVKGCGLQDGVKVTAVGGIALSTPAMIDCTTARALHAWIESGLKPAVGRLGGGVERLEVAASYSCRPRNNRKGGRISEHGRGRAIDIAAIVLRNGTSLSVLDGWHSASQGKVLRRIHKAACGPFNTTLGPGSDGYHENHFHFDTARGRGPYCR